MALRAVIDHPKSADLKMSLGVPRFIVIGLLESIWHFCGRFTPQGNIGKYSDRQIESWVEWNGEPGALIRALVEAHWLDTDPEYRLIVHDWDQHADEATKKTLLRGHRAFVVSTASRQRLDMSRPPEPEPEPEPEPAAAANVTIVEPGIDGPAAAAASKPPADFPISRRLIAQSFPGTDSAMSTRIIAAACRGKPDASDDEVAEALIRTHKGKQQQSAALWLKTVPAYFEQQRRADPPGQELCPDCNGFGEILSPECNGVSGDVWSDWPHERAWLPCPRCRDAPKKQPETAGTRKEQAHASSA